MPTEISASNVLVPTCWSNATTTKIWRLQNFLNFFFAPKIENIEISSSATCPYLSFVLIACTRWSNTSQASFIYHPNDI